MMRAASIAVDRCRSALLILWLRGAYPGLRIGRGVVIGTGTRIRLLNGAILEIGDRTVIDAYCHLVSQGVLTIGRDGYVGTGSTIVATDRIDIGADALIAAHSVIRDQDHRSDLPGPYRAQGLVARPIRIGSNVWLGAHAIILKGIAIGDGAIVAAGAVVTRDVPPSTVVAGTPARVLSPRRAPGPVMPADAGDAGPD